MCPLSQDRFTKQPLDCILLLQTSCLGALEEVAFRKNGAQQMQFVLNLLRFPTQTLGRCARNSRM